LPIAFASADSKSTHWFNRSPLGARMKRIMLTTVAGVALLACAPAMAADLAVKAPRVAPVAPPPPAFSWTGCFIGAHWGWGFGKKDVDETEVDNILSGFIVETFRTSGTVDTSGPLFGGQVGCDYEFGVGKGFGPGGFVIGIQGDIAAADINGFEQDPFLASFNDDRSALLRVKEDTIASVTGRIGFVLPAQVLWYFRGGGAWTHDRWDLALAAQNRDTFAGLGANVFTQSRSGWTVGAGVEWAFLPNWSAFVEWDHYDFGTKNLVSNTDCFITCAVFAQTQSIETKQRVETVKIGVNYRFNLFGLGGVGKGKAPVVARY
jgi:outer membrane immunogenic protein